MNVTDERAIYIEETAQWYKHDSIFWNGVQADSYPEAFEKLYGHSQVIPPPVRAPKRELIQP